MGFAKIGRNLNTSDKEEDPQETTHQPMTTHLVTPLSIPIGALQSLLAVPDSIQRFLDQNQRAIEQFAKTASFYKAMNPRLMSEVSKIIDIQNKLISISKTIPFPAFELASTANLSIEHLIATDTVRINGILTQAASQSSIWEEQRQVLYKITESLGQYDAIWHSHLLDISRFSLLSQASLSQISWEQIGNALDIQDVTRNRLQSVFLDFSQSYSGLFASLEAQPSIIASLPPVISKLPAVEFFNSVNVVETITVNTEENAELEDEKQQTTEEAKRETEDRLESLLAELNKELIIPLQGARQSIDSTNPDHIRHFATSLRELFTHVLHILAPDEKIKEWSNAQEHYDKGKPTRRARLLYICRDIDHGPFSTFIEKDIDADLAFLQLFQQGTHEVAPQYTDLQLRAMLVWMESMLRSLLEIWHAS